jgi:NAD(P)-dependent dehydrogenase (short-subunit alcohol dehydrogenase family)
MKIALITGGSAGIGRVIAERLAQEKYDGIAIAARHLQNLEDTAREITATFAVPVLPVPTDVRDPEQVRQLVARVIEEFGQIDTLVNNAGLYSSGPVEKFSLEDWHQVLDTNLWGYIHTIESVLPHLIAQRAGAIVNICSIAGKVPMPYLVPYTTSKHAIAGLSQSLSAELAPKGIHVCAIYPNIIRTGFVDRAVIRGQDSADKAARRQQLEQTLAAPFVEKPEDVANAVWQALSERRSDRTPGSAKLLVGMNATFPKATRWLLRTLFQNQDRAA